MMGLGMGEVVVILVIALMVFGPRKLPELGKSLGQAMNQFRRASDEFKRTWEQEVEYDKVRKDGDASTAAIGSGDHDSGYHAESDYHYGYDHMSASEAASTNSTATAETVTAAALPEPQAETNAVVSVPEKKAEPQWI
jgi:TatA/E family protein of Tat protein translocase